MNNSKRIMVFFAGAVLLAALSVCAGANFTVTKDSVTFLTPQNVTNGVTVQGKNSG